MVVIKDRGDQFVCWCHQFVSSVLQLILLLLNKIHVIHVTEMKDTCHRNTTDTHHMPTLGAVQATCFFIPTPFTTPTTTITATMLYPPLPPPKILLVSTT